MDNRNPYLQRASSDYHHDEHYAVQRSRASDLVRPYQPVRGLTPEAFFSNCTPRFASLARAAQSAQRGTVPLTDVAGLAPQPKQS